MNMKALLYPVVCTAAAGMIIAGCSQKNNMTATTASVVTPESAAEETAALDYAAIIEDIPTVQAFLEEAVPEEDESRIVMAGINAPSAMNGQPWHFL